MFDVEYIGSIAQKAKALRSAEIQIQKELDFYLKIVGEHSGIVGKISDDGLTSDQRDILLDFVNLFLRSYPHYQLQSVVSTGIIPAPTANGVHYQFGGVRVDD